jgi:3-deoxy-D-manno-octulosonic-acid transferase
MTGPLRCWFHAVSVGEVAAAAPIIRAVENILPETSFVISTTTEHGQALARERLGRIAACVYAPVDLIPVVRRALTVFKPNALIMVETEIWPNWLIEAGRMGIPTALVNGRISEGSFRRYRRIRPLIKYAVSPMRAFSMISRSDAQRIHRLGAPAHRLIVNGNAKYDGLADQVSDAIREGVMAAYGLEDTTAVLVAGSTRGRENAMIIDAFRKLQQTLPESVLILAPRHLDRIPAVEVHLRTLGLKWQRRSDLDEPGAVRTAPIVILDRIGELMAVYSVASVVFCGGSLVPKGGQNILEPAAWGKPVLYGPSMEDFSDAKILLEENGAGFQVDHSDSLAKTAAYLMQNAPVARAAGGRGQAVVQANTGAAARHAAVVCRLLGRS